MNMWIRPPSIKSSFSHLLQNSKGFKSAVSRIGPNNQLCKYGQLPGLQMELLGSQIVNRFAQLLACSPSIPELSSIYSETGDLTYRYSAIKCTHHLKPSIAVVTGIYHLLPSLSTIVLRHHLNLSDAAIFSCIATAAEFSASEVVFGILLTVINRNKLMDWAPFSISNSTVYRYNSTIIWEITNINTT